MNRKFLTALATALILITCISCGREKTEKIGYKTSSHPSEIEVSWKSRNEASRYEIYRIDITGAIYTSDNVPFKKYEKVGRVSGTTYRCADTAVKNGRYYAYAIRGFNGEKLVCDSFDPNITQYECAGLARPDLIDNGYGENYVNGPDALYFYVQIDGGMAAESIELYRKAEGEKSFSPVEAETISSGEDGKSFELKDTHVRPHTKYTYKVRTATKESGETVKSDFSETVTLYAINFVGKYKVIEIKSDPDKNKLTLKIKSDENNGVLRIGKGAPAVLRIDDDGDEESTYDFTLDQKKVVQPGQEALLEFTSVGGRIPDTDGLKATLNIEDEGIRYDEFGGYTTLSLDLASKSGTVFADYDN